MEKQIGSIERKSKKHHGSIGSFFFGWFIGLLTFVLLIGGTGAFIYFKVSPSWINKTFHANIDLGSDQLNDLTLNTLVKHSVNLAKNIDTYTLNDLEKDFGVKVGDKLAGIDISDLKNVVFPNLLTAAKDKITNISADELSDVINLSDMEKILSKKITFYYNDGHLYKEFNKDAGTYSNEADLDFSVENGVVTIGNQPCQIEEGNKITVQFRYLPLVKAVSYMTTELGSNTTVGELKDYGLNLPSQFDKIDQSTRLNDLEEEINKLYVADLLKYNVDETTGVVTNESGEEVKGVMKVVAKETVGNLTNLAHTIETMQIADVLNFTVEGDVVKDANGQPVKGILAKIATLSVNELTEDKINTFTVQDLFPDSYNTGALSLIPANTTLQNIPSVLSDTIQASKISELQASGLLNITNTSALEKETTISNGAGGYKKVGECTVSELIDDYFNKLDEIDNLKQQNPAA